MSFNNKKTIQILIISLLVLVILAIMGGFYYYFQSLNAKTAQEKDIYKSFTFSNSQIEELVKIGEEDLASLSTIPVTKYKIGNATVAIHFDNGEYFEVYDGDYYFKSEKQKYTNLNVYQYKNNRYFVVYKPSGGAFCCFAAYVFSLKDNGSPVLIATIGDLEGNINNNKRLMIDSAGMDIIKLGEKLYVKIADGRFHYFLSGGRPSSFDISQYLLIDGEKVVLANQDLKNEFLRSALEIDQDLSSCIENNTCATKLNILSLGEMMANYVLAGEDQKANERIDFYFNSGKCSDCEGKKEELKNEIKEKISVDCYSQDGLINSEIYRSEKYGFEFNYPDSYFLKEYNAENIYIKKDKDDTTSDINIEIEEESEFYNDQTKKIESTSSLNFLDFATRRILMGCAADGPSGSRYCTKVTKTDSFVNSQGTLVYSIFVNQVVERYDGWKETGDKREDIIGPFFAIDISEQTDNKARAIIFENNSGEDGSLTLDKDNPIISTFKFINN